MLKEPSVAFEKSTTKTAHPVRRRVLTPLVRIPRPSRDHRHRLPRFLHRFVGYREPGQEPPYTPLPFFDFSRFDIKYEIYVSSFLGAFGGITLIETVMIKSDLLEGYGVPLILGSFGASAVLIHGALESPLSQPRNFILGHMISALISVVLTLLFNFRDEVTNVDSIPGGFYHLRWINASLAMSLSLLIMQMTGTLHPPGGATALLGVISPNIVELRFKYLLVVLVSVLLMLGWALIINNIGRRRYPMYWWTSDSMLRQDHKDERDEMRMMEEGGPATIVDPIQRRLSRNHMNDSDITRIGDETLQRQTSL